MSSDDRVLRRSRRARSAVRSDEAGILGDELLILDHDGCPRLRRATWRERVASRWRCASLDTRIRAGADVDRDPRLMLRAQLLTSRENRDRLAHELLRRLDRDAQRSGRRAAPLGPCRSQLGTIAAALLAPGPVSTQGVAGVQVLLAWSDGPLRRRSARGRLPDELDWILQTLQR